MEYKMIKRGERDLRLEKHMESKGFFRNAGGSSKVGEIKLYDDTENEKFENFLMDWEICYMELGCIDGFGLLYRGESPSVSIGNKINNIPVEDRIEFLYESFNPNSNYNCLGIVRKIRYSMGNVEHRPSLFEISGGLNFEDLSIVTFNIRD